MRWRNRQFLEWRYHGASLQQAQSMVRYTNINTTLVYSHNLDRVNQTGEFAVDRMLE